MSVPTSSFTLDPAEIPGQHFTLRVLSPLSLSRSSLAALKSEMWWTHVPLPYVAKDRQLAYGVLVDSDRVEVHDCPYDDRHVTATYHRHAQVDMIPAVSDQQLSPFIYCDHLILITEGIQESLLQSDLTGVFMEQVTVTGGSGFRPSSPIFQIQFRLPERRAPRKLRHGFSNKCSTCGYGPLYCATCDSFPVRCLQCSERVLVQKIQPGSQDSPYTTEIFDKHVPQTIRPIDLSRTVVADFMGSRTISRRALELFVRLGAFPFAVRPVPILSASDKSV